MAPVHSKLDLHPQSRPPPIKLPRLPPNTHIRKRPLLHPPIPSPYASASQKKIIYISTHTPFISVVKRVRKLLDLVEKRAGGSGLVGLTNGKGGEGRRLRALERSLEGDGEGMKGKEEVILKATNRAIEKALGLAVFFQGQGDCRVCLRTGTVGTVDDILEGEGGRQSGGKMKGKKGKKGKGKDGGREGEGRDVEMEDKEPEVEEEFPETRIRKVSVLEVAITMK